MKNLLFISLFLAVPVSAQILPQKQNITDNYQRALASYGTASPEVCVEIARGYNISLEADTNSTDYYLDMMIARCAMYYRGDEKEAQFVRLLEADKRMIELHRKLVGTRTD